MANKRLGVKELTSPSVDSILFGLSSENNAVELDISELHAFKDHPFLVTEDNSLFELSNPIKENGLIEPITVRPRTDGGYEIIIGHRRVRASKLAEFTTIKANILDIDDDTATIMMVDSNLHREKKLFSEKAFSYKMKLEAMRRQVKRSDLTSVQTEQKSDEKGETSRDIMSREIGESSSAIQRYIRLTFLQHALLYLIDIEKVPFTVGVELSHLKENEQEWVFDALNYQDYNISFVQGKVLRKLSQENSLKKQSVKDILKDKKSPPKKLKINYDDISAYFPEEYTGEEIIDEIFKLVKNKQTI